MKDIGTLLVEGIELDGKLMVESIRSGNTSVSCASMEAVRVLSQLGLKLIENNHLKTGSWVETLKEIAVSVSEVVKENLDDSSVAEEGLDELEGFIKALDK